MEKPPFSVYRFWTEYPTDKKTGQLTPVDWVEYGPFGSDKVVNKDKVSRLLAVRDIPADTNPAAALAQIRANFIRKHYEAWKAGQQLPEDGTPLAAWNGVSAEQADILKTKGFKTVELVASMTDTHIQNTPIPGMRGIVENAKRFMASSEQTKVAADLAQKDEQIAALKAEQDELTKLVRELLEEKKAEETAQVEAAKQSRKQQKVAA
jgi:signal transduction histidine kinase